MIDHGTLSYQGWTKIQESHGDDQQLKAANSYQLELHPRHDMFPRDAGG